jgi:hypothetical protein
MHLERGGDVLIVIFDGIRTRAGVRRLRRLQPLRGCFRFPCEPGVRFATPGYPLKSLRDRGNSPKGLHRKVIPIPSRFPIGNMAGRQDVECRGALSAVLAARVGIGIGIAIGIENEREPEVSRPDFNLSPQPMTPRPNGANGDPTHPVPCALSGHRGRCVAWSPGFHPGLSPVAPSGQPGFKLESSNLKLPSPGEGTRPSVMSRRVRAPGLQ